MTTSKEKNIATSDYFFGLSLGLVVRDFDLDPHEVTRILGIEPTIIRVKGEKKLYMGERLKLI